MQFLTTLQAAKRIGVTISRLQRALWLGQVDRPQQGPGGAFLWDTKALNKASWQLLGRACEGTEELNPHTDIQKGRVDS